MNEPTDLFADSALSAIGVPMSEHNLPPNPALGARHNHQLPYQTAQFSQGFGSIETEGSAQREQNKELLTITIEIGNGQNENIIIRDQDSPRDLAK